MPVYCRSFFCVPVENNIYCGCRLNTLLFHNSLSFSFLFLVCCFGFFCCNMCLSGFSGHGQEVRAGKNGYLEQEMECITEALACKWSKCIKCMYVMHWNPVGIWTCIRLIPIWFVCMDTMTFGQSRLHLNLNAFVYIQLFEADSSALLILG